MTQSGDRLANIWVNLRRRPRTGLALSGGGARGLAHIGVLKVLAREGIPVDCLAGTSMGGVIAAACAAGMSAAEIERQALLMARWRNLLSLADLGLPRRGLFKGDRLLAYFERHLGQRTFADLTTPLALVAVDLNTGQEIILREGPVALAVRATVALPGLLAPVEMEGRRLADGGLLNNLPADVVRQMGAELVIAVDVSAKHGEVWRNHIRWAPEGVAETIQVLGESVGVMMSAINEQKLKQARPEVLIRPVIPPGVNVVAGYHRAEELIGAGERAAEAALPLIRAQMHPRWHWLARGRTRDETGSRDGHGRARPTPSQPGRTAS
jgi:NTE family protein